MPRVCTVCTHPKRDEIDAALVAGESYREITRHYRVSKDALSRHKQDHMPAHLAKAKEAAEVVQADNLLERLMALNRETQAILREARTGKDKDNDLALKAIARAEKQLELEARLLGELQEGAVINIYASPEWLALRALVVQALAPYPEAARAVTGALSDT